MRRKPSSGVEKLQILAPKPPKRNGRLQTVRMQTTAPPEADPKPDAGLSMRQ